MDSDAIDAISKLLRQRKIWKQGQALRQSKTNGSDFTCGLLRHLIFIGFSFYIIIVPVWFAFQIML